MRFYREQPIVTFVPLSERRADFGQRTGDVMRRRDVGDIGDATMITVRVVAVYARVASTWSRQI